jgi:iron(III) transport system permease protein
MATSAAAAVVFLLLLTFILWPLVTVLAVSVTGTAGSTLRLVPILVNSLAVSAVSTVVTVLLALVLAYTATRTTVPGGRFLSLLRWVPLASPPFLVPLALILLFGSTGALTHSLGLHWSIHGFHGLVVAQVFTFLPQAFILLAGVLGRVDPALEEAAESLGAARLLTLRRVTLALARPGLASASLIVFILCMADFGNPILVGGRVEVLTTEIYAQMVGLNDVAAASVLGVILSVPCLAAYLINTYWIGARSDTTAPTGTRPARRPTPAAVRWPLAAVSGGVVLLNAVIYALIPLGFLLNHDGFLSSAEGAAPIWNSVRLALVCGIVGTALALVAAYVVARPRVWGARGLESLALLPAALPGPVIGVGYVLAFSAAPLLMGGTIWILVVVVVCWKLPVAVVAAVAALRRIDPALEEAAVSLGAGPVRTFVRVVLPLVSRPALSIFVSFFIDGMLTVSAVIFLVEPGFRLGSVAILDQVAGGSLGAACALATAILVIVLAPVVLLRAVGGADGEALLENGWRRSPV